MALTLNAYTESGLFKAAKIISVSVTDSGSTVEGTINAKGGKEPLYIIIDLSSATGISGLHFNFKSADGKKTTKVPLTANMINVVPITTYGFIKEDGFMDFELSNESGAAMNDKNIKLGLLKHVPVINR